jgi:predicted acylesterase/phospholipase RssA
MKALVFNGCGALGAYQAGAMLALYAKGYRPDHIYGVSSGAINAIATAFMNPLGPEKFWKAIDGFKSAFAFNWPWRGSDGVFRPRSELFELFESLLVKEAPLAPISIFTVSTSDGEVERHDFKILDKPALMNAGLAACAIPGLVESRNGRYDAGFRVLAPLSYAVADGATEITLISGRPLGGPTPRIGSIRPKELGAAYHAIDMGLAEILKRDVAKLLERNEQAVFRKIGFRVVAPTTAIGGPLDFARCKEFFDLGEGH